jgi:hypothetical protein
LNAKAQDEKLKAIFIYNFVKYINWPEQAGNFVILVLGNSAIIGEIEGVSAKKKAANKTIEVKRVNTPGEISQGHILFIPAAKTDLLAEVVPVAKSKNLLIITEKPNACKNGSGINFTSSNGKITFEVSKTNIVSCGLAVSNDLLTLGTQANN